MVGRETAGGILRLSFEAERIPGALRRGDSIAVSGVCLTVVVHHPRGFAVDVSGETLSRTGLGDLQPGDRVNLELPLAANGRLGGHFVQGHVDGLGRLASIETRGGDRIFRIEHPASSDPLVVEKGSIAVDGVSLTVADCGPGWFEVMLIPHTLRATTLGERRPGDALHLEYDILAKYVMERGRVYRPQG